MIEAVEAAQEPTSAQGELILRCASTSTCSNLPLGGWRGGGGGGVGGWGRGGGVRKVTSNSCQMCRIPRAHVDSHTQWNACEEPNRK